MKGHEIEYRVNEQGMIVEEIYERKGTKLESMGHQQSEEYLMDEKAEVAC